MGYALTDKNFIVGGGVTRSFVCDTENDVSSLPPSAPGSSAVVIKTGNVYMVNSSGQWELFGGA